MRKILVFALTLSLLAILDGVCAQKIEKAQINKSIEVDSYGFDMELLKNCFTNQLIPVSFPKLTKSISEDEHTGLIREWLADDANYQLLSDYGKKMFSGINDKSWRSRMR